MIISTDEEIAHYKIQHPFTIKNTLNKLGTEGHHLNTIKPLYRKTTASIRLNGEKKK